MNNIKILIKAYGCIGDDYEGKETVKEKLIKKDPAQVDLTENDLKQILKYLIRVFKANKRAISERSVRRCF